MFVLLSADYFGCGRSIAGYPVCLRGSSRPCSDSWINDILRFPLAGLVTTMTTTLAGGHVTPAPAGHGMDLFTDGTREEMRIRTMCIPPASWQIGPF
ncbi:hypothetical protein D9757_012148 [Collybiopsis confluens]|uniref:Uncharacterized protein n=1 Tax=Collybiopsis confluens TaxID=2823264 RepID=A0A8H5G7T4_9AGAR|nr:hypothetical protein D9757_012148 [Collybiopsis confluens]